MNGRKNKILQQKLHLMNHKKFLTLLLETIPYNYHLTVLVKIFINIEKENMYNSRSIVKLKLSHKCLLSRVWSKNIVSKTIQNMSPKI
jgi:hypothetical protein